LRGPLRGGGGGAEEGEREYEGRGGEGREGKGEGIGGARKVVCPGGALALGGPGYGMIIMVWYAMNWYGMLRYGMIWYDGMVWYGMVWYGIDLYKEFSMSTTSIGLLRAEMSVNPTMSLK